MKPDFFNLTVQRLHNVSPDWRWCKYESHDLPEDYMRLTGAVPTETYRSGPRKGRTKWPKQRDTFLIRQSDVDRTMELWEAQTGQCANCGGTGQEWAGWSKEEGTRTKVCKRCNGSGRLGVKE